MTAREYVSAYLGKFGLSDSEIDFILFESDIDPTTTVSADNKVAIKTAMYQQIPVMLAGLKDVTEGGFSIKWNLAAITAWYSLLASELGLDDLLAVKPTVKDASNRW